MPVNTPALGPGGGPNAPFGIGSPKEGAQTSIGALTIASNFGASVDTTSASSNAPGQLSTVSYTGVLYSVPANDSLTTTLVWHCDCPGF